MHLSFDFDYTLADSSDGTVVCATWALGRLDLGVPPDDAIRKTVGLSLERTFAALTGGDPASTAAAEFKRLFLEHATRVMLQHIHLYPSTGGVLRWLKEQQHYVSIVSTKRKEHILNALARDGFDGAVDDVVGGGCVQRNKPDPEGILLAGTRSGIDLSEMVYVGDSASDGEGAQRAGISFIGLLSGHADREQLSRWNPIAILEGIAELPDWLASRG